MPIGKQSRAKLADVHSDLVRLAESVYALVDAGALRHAGIYDCTVLCGWRGQEEQDKAFRDGHSKLKWPSSKHNHTERATRQRLSLAIDFAPYPVPDYSEKEPSQVRQWSVFRGFVLGVAATMDIKLRVISWDAPHFELEES